MGSESAEEPEAGASPMEAAHEAALEGETVMKLNPRYMTLEAAMAGASYIANAEAVMPSPLRMMAAMTVLLSDL